VLRLLSVSSNGGRSKANQEEFQTGADRMSALPPEKDKRIHVMNKLTFSLLVLLAALAFSQAAKAAQPEVKTFVGHWTLKTRTCVSGISTKDEFQLGRDSLKLQIAGKASKAKMESELNLNGKTDLKSSVLEPRGIATSFVNPFTGQNDIIIYQQPTNDELEVFSVGFEGGACAKGDALKSVFVRVKNSLQAGM
jgi:hypothetical protein